MRSLQRTNPIARLHTDSYKRFLSPFQRIARSFPRIPIALECIQPYTLAPWERRIPLQIEDGEAPIPEGLQIATSSSARNGLVGSGFALRGDISISATMTIGPQTEQNTYTAELAAVAMAVTHLPSLAHHMTITILTSNQAALLAICHPRQQSGQESIKQIYKKVRELRARANIIQGQWMPLVRTVEVSDCAKMEARQSTEQGKSPEEESRAAMTTILSVIKRESKAQETLPKDIGKYSQEIDAALPGRHTKAIYDTLNKKEAGTLAQLRTGMARINSYLHRIGVSSTDQCDCGVAKETVKHFLLLCPRWDHLRAGLLQQLGTRVGDISFCLGGRSRNLELDPSPWKPDMNAVRATIRYAIATGRLLAEEQVPP